MVKFDYLALKKLPPKRPDYDVVMFKGVNLMFIFPLSENGNSNRGMQMWLVL